MKNKIFVAIISIIAIILLVITFVFAINYKKETENYFYESGYILSNKYESGSENVSKLYFDAKTSYKDNKNSEYTFKNSEGEKVNVSEESFVHYSNGSIMSLKKGVAIDLNEIDSKMISYYNIFEESVLMKKNEVYEIDNLNNKITFSKLMFKISNEKYLIGASKIIISFSDDQAVEMENYVEIEYVSENIIRIYNDIANYQTIASNLYIIIDDIKIDLEYKTISKGNKQYLTMADMVINADDNIEILPVPEDIKQENDGDADNQGSDSNQNSQNNNQGNNGGSVDSQLQQGVDNLIQNLPDNNEQIDTENEFIQPKFKVDSINVTTLGFENLNISFEDESSVLYGNRTVEILENSTGKVVQRFEDWQEGSQNYTVNSYYNLKPNTEYTLNVSGQYKVDETVFDRTFISKIFRTLDVGIEIVEDYITSDSLSFAIYKSSYSEVTGFSYDITDKKGNIIIEDTTVNFKNSNVVVITDENEFAPNTEYILTLKNLKYGNTTFLTVSYDKLKITHKIKTLKENPFRNSDVTLTSSINNRENTITFDVRGINDLYGGIKSYTYNVYNNIGELKYTIEKQKAESLTLDLEKLDDEDTIFFNVEIDYDDNEKTIMFVSQNSEPISLDGVQYPKIVKFLKGEDELDAQHLVGSILIDDKDQFILSNGVSKYKIDIKENSNSYVGATQQFIDSITIEQEKGNKEFSLPVYFEGLTPNTEYVLYVYLFHNDEYVYLGYEVAKTEESQPLYLNFTQEENENSKKYLFDFQITKSANSTSANYVTGLDLELHACSKTNNQCKKLEEYSRTVPKSQNMKDELYNAMQYNPEKEISETNKKNTIFVNSNEFGFGVDNYNNDYNYKIVVIGKGQGYEIPVKINGLDSNEFEIKINDVEPQLEVKAIEVSKQECEERNQCKAEYSSINSDLDDKTIVGFDFEINYLPNPMGEKIKKVNYMIYEAEKETECDALIGTNKTSVINSNVSLDSTNKVFIPLGNSNNQIKLKRGNKYCIEYYGIYDSDDQEQTTLPKTIKIEPMKQGVKLTGYIKGYDGSDLTSELKITDPDSSLVSNSLVLENNISLELIQPEILDNNEYKFKNLRSSDYVLMIEEDIGEGNVSKKIQEINLDNILSYSNLKIIVDTSNPGEIILRVPYKGENAIDKNRIAGISLTSNNQSHLLNFNGETEEELYVKMSLDVIKNQGYGRILQQNDPITNEEKDFWTFDSLKVIYDNGKIVDYKGPSKPMFLRNKGINTNWNEGYFSTNRKFEKIKTTSIIYTSQLNNVASINESVFDSNVEDSRIGILLQQDGKLPVPIYFNEVGYADTILYDEKGNIKDTNSFEVKSTLTTSLLETKYNSTGAKVNFRITNSNISPNTKLQIILNKTGENTDILELIYNNNEWISTEASEKISFKEENNNIMLEFSNISDGEYKYSIKYSIDDSNFEYTYNIADQKSNKNINISSLKTLKASSLESEYKKINWRWNSDNTTIETPIKKVTSYFEIDTSTYELKENEVIKYSIIATGISKEGLLPNEEIEIEKDIELNDINSKEYYLESLILNSNYIYYDISIQPYIVNGNNITNLNRFSLTGTNYLKISYDDPSFSVSANQNAIFKITLTDEDIMLNACSESKLRDLYDMQPMSFTDNNTQSYFEENRYNSKAVYFELYKIEGENERFIGFSPIPFANKTSDLNLSEYISENGIYRAKFRYCTFGNEDIREVTIRKELDIQSSSMFRIKLIELSDSYVLMFENPNGEDLNNIKRIKYQITDINGFSRTIELSNLDDEINTGNNIEFVNSSVEGGKTLYFVGLPTGGLMTSKIRSLDIQLYSGLEDKNPLGTFSKG